MVFDEAHEIEDVASDYFGRQLSSYRFEELARDTENVLRVLRIESAHAARQLARVRERGRAASSRIFRSARDAIPFGPPRGKHFSRAIGKPTTNSRAAVKRIETELSALTPKPEEVLTLARRAAEVAPRAGIPARERGKELRLLVRAARAWSLSRGDADRRERNPARKTCSTSSTRWC